jgi:Skp family chaperone for outer membrane proteins
MLPAMHRPGVFLLLFLALAGVGLASPRIAVVRISDIYRGLDSTVALNEEVRGERASVERDARKKALDDARAELQALYKQLLKSAEEEADPGQRERMERAYVMKTQEAMTLQREFVSFRDRRLQEINGRMVQRMEASLARIRSVAAEVGEAKGYDWVLDSTGNTNTGLPFVLYAKSPPDLTDEVIAALSEPSTETADTSER